MKNKWFALFLSAITLFTAAPYSVFAASSGWISNLSELSSTANKPAKITYSENGVTLTRTHENDGLAISKTKAAGNFTLESDVTFVSGNVANLIFGAESSTSAEDSFIFKLDRSNRSETKLFNFSSAHGFPTITTSQSSFPLHRDRYHMKVTVVDGTCVLYLDEELISSTKLPDYYQNGYLGIGAAEGSTVTFQNTTYTDLGTQKLAKITDIAVDGMVLTPAYSEDVTAYGVMAVPHETDSVRITVTLSEGTGNLTVAGKKAESKKPVEVALEVGKNTVLILITDEESGACVPVSLSITRKAAEEDYRTEDYRGQYHFSPLEGWINDPNGLIYYKDQWHLFYQYIPLTTAHSDAEKHWGHAVSDDLVHWEDLPVALAPDKELGSIWSGSAIADPDNKSGLFPKKSEDNLVAFFTHRADNGVQVQSLAYSADGGISWTKYAENPILTAKDDPLNDGAFRDPNVFWCDSLGKYLMALAGGPLRLYSSDDLIHWTFESGYDNTHPEYRPSGVGSIDSECPDLFPLAVEGDTDIVKWIYTGAGDWYMIGDLKEVNGKICYVPDSQVRYPLEFGHDAYAGVTFKNGPDGRVVMISWMANWGYANQMPTDPWNGSFTLCYELSLRKTDAGLRIFQNPVKEYESLRGEALVEIQNALIGKDHENPLKGCSSDQFELLAHLTPDKTVTEMGLRLLQGTSYEMTVRYDPKTARLTLDRSNVSDVKPGSYQNDSISSYTVTPNPDGSIDLRVFVDWGSIEVIVGNGEIYAAELLFPDYASIGMEAYAKGGIAIADITVYPLDTIWREKESTKITGVSLDVKNGEILTVGETYTVHARVESRFADQTVIFTVDGDENAVEILSHSENSLTLKMLKEGNFRITATAKGTDVSAYADLSSMTNTFHTNLTDWESSGNGTWSTVAGGLQGVTGNDGFAVGSESFEGDFTLSLDVTMHEGTAFGIVFFAKDRPGDGSYMVNFDLTDPVHGKKFRFTEFPYHGSVSNNAERLFSDSATPVLGKTHHIELIWKDGMLTYVFDGVTVFDQEIDRDPSVAFHQGKIGVMGFNSRFTVNNVLVTAPSTEDGPDVTPTPPDTAETPDTTDSPVDTPDTPTSTDIPADTNDAPNSGKPEKSALPIVLGSLGVALLAVGGAIAAWLIRKKKQKKS